MKKFRLLLVMSSLLAFTGLFSACTTNAADELPAVTVELTAGAVTETSLTFNVKATGADDVYYWVSKEELAADASLEFSKGTYLDASVDEEFSEDVVLENLVAGTQYYIYAFAQNFAHNKYAAPLTMSTGALIPVPTVSVSLVEGEVYPDAFLVLVTTANAQSGSWMVVPKYTEGVTAEMVLEQGTALDNTQLNKTDAEVFAEELTPNTAYDFYVAVENQGKVTLSDVLGVVTAKPEAQAVELKLNTLFNSTNLMDVANLPGLFFQLGNAEGNDFAQLFMYDLTTFPDYVGYMFSGSYPLLPGSYQASELPEQNCVLADPLYTSFNGPDGIAYMPVVGESETDADGTIYGVDLITMMPNMDNNQLTLNIPCQDMNGTDFIVRGVYTGPLGYAVGPVTYPFNLEQWGFTDFEKSVDGNTVTLTSNSVTNGTFKMILETEGGVIDEASGAAFVAGEGGNLTGGFTSYVEGAPEEFAFTSGRISFEKVDDAGNWLLHVSTKAGDWVMEGASGAYKIEALEYAITISEAPSIDAKQWELPSTFAELLAGNSSVRCLADLGVSMPGKLILGIDNESAYGEVAAGTGTPMMMLDYSVEAETKTSGNIAIVQTNHFGESTTIKLPYSNLTATSVTVDFTNMNMGVGVSECTLFTGNVVFQMQ